MKKIFMLLISILMLSCAQKDNDTIVVGVYNMFPPFVYVDEEGRYDIVGFDIELAKVIAKKYNKTLKLEVMKFDELIPAAASGRVDIAISGITITEERKQKVNFSTSYHESSRAVVVRRDELESYSDIRTKEELGANKRLAAQSGTIGSIVANQIAHGNQVVEKESWTLALSELTNSNVDAVIMERNLARYSVSKYEDLVVLPITFDVEYYGIAVKKDNRELLASINTIIASIVNSGEYSKLVDEYIHGYFSE